MLQVSGELAWRAGRNDRAVPVDVALGMFIYMPDILFGTVSHRAGQ